MIQQDPIVVLGAGLAGLSTAYELSENGRAVTVVEKTPFVGGLARSVQRNGFIFDLGGHRIYSDKKWIIEKLSQILGDELQVVQRKSRIRLGEKFINYPPKPSSVISSFGFYEGMKILNSYMLSTTRFKITPQNEHSFEQWAVNRFGSRMYEAFLKPYTEKVCGLPCSEMSAEWGVERVGIQSLLEAIKRAVFKQKGSPRTFASQFYYPEDGISTVAAKMADKIGQRKNKLMLGWEVQEVRWKQETIKSLLIGNASEEAELMAEHFVSTIPVTLLVSLMRPKAPSSVLEAAENLKYRALVCIMLIVDRESITDDNWIYFPDKDVMFIRAHEPRNWSEKLVQKGKTSLCVEITCNQDDQIWQAADDQLIERAVANLSRLQILRADEVTDSFVERVPYAYPLLRLGYQDHLAKLLGYLSQFKNLHLLGRTGMFQYWSMDQVIEEGVLKAKELLRQ